MRLSAPFSSPRRALTLATILLVAAATGVWMLGATGSGTGADRGLSAVARTSGNANRVPDPARVLVGRALFDGSAELPGRVVGHSRDLPVMASRCANCHVAVGGADLAAPTLIPATTTTGTTNVEPATRPFGPPRLDRQGLTRLQTRRGGPPSRYDADSFCAVLRTGIDPAGVMIDQTMPRYRPDPAQCAALWAFLTSPASTRKTP